MHNIVNALKDRFFSDVGISLVSYHYISACVLV